MNEWFDCMKFDETKWNGMNAMKCNQMNVMKWNDRQNHKLNDKLNEKNCVRSFFK